MNREKLTEFEKMISNRQMSQELIKSCLANLEPRISKAAYFKKKFAHAPEFARGSHEYEFKTLIGYRNKLIRLLKPSLSLSEVQEEIKRIPKEDIVSIRVRDLVIELIDNGDYIIV